MPGIDDLIKGAFDKYDKAGFSEEKAQKIKDFYGDDYEALVKGMFDKYDKDGYSEEKSNEILEFYGLSSKKKVQEEPSEITSEETPQAEQEGTESVSEVGSSESQEADYLEFTVPEEKTEAELEFFKYKGYYPGEEKQALEEKQETTKEWYDDAVVKTKEALGEDFDYLSKTTEEIADMLPAEVDDQSALQVIEERKSEALNKKGSEYYNQKIAKDSEVYLNQDNSIEEAEDLAYRDYLKSMRSEGISYLGLDESDSKKYKTYIDEYYKLRQIPFKERTPEEKARVHELKDIVSELKENPTKSFINPDTGEVDGEKEKLINELASIYSVEVKNDFQKFTDRYKREYDNIRSLRSDLYNTFKDSYNVGESDNMSDELIQSLKTDYENTKPGGLVEFLGLPSQEEMDAFSKADVLFKEYQKSTDNFAALSRALLLNEDPGAVSRGFEMLEGIPVLEEVGTFATSFGESFAEAIPGVENVSTDRDFRKAVVNIANEEGVKLTQEQYDSAVDGWSERLGDQFGTSAEIMAEIIGTTLITKNASSFLGISDKLGKLVNVLGGGEKAAKYTGVALQGLEQAIAFDLASQGSAAMGVGEFLGAKGADKLLNILSRGKTGKFMKLLKPLTRVMGATTAGTIEEYGGEYLDQAFKNGFLSEETFRNTFGRDYDEAKDKLLMTLILTGTFGTGAEVANMYRLGKDYYKDSGDVTQLNDVEKAYKEIQKARTESELTRFDDMSDAELEQYAKDNNVDIEDLKKTLKGKKELISEEKDDKEKLEEELTEEDLSKIDPRKLEDDSKEEVAASGVLQEEGKITQPDTFTKEELDQEITKDSLKSTIDKISNLQSKLRANPKADFGFSAGMDMVLEIVKTGLKAGMTIRDAFAKAKTDFKNTEDYNKLSEEDKSKLESLDITDLGKEELSREKPKTPEEIKSWSDEISAPKKGEKKDSVKKLPGSTSLAVDRAILDSANKKIEEGKTSEEAISESLEEFKNSEEFNKLSFEQRELIKDMTPEEFLDQRNKIDNDLNFLRNQGLTKAEAEGVIDYYKDKGGSSKLRSEFADISKKLESEVNEIYNALQEFPGEEPEVEKKKADTSKVNEAKKRFKELTENEVNKKGILKLKLNELFKSLESKKGSRKLTKKEKARITELYKDFIIKSETKKVEKTIKQKIKESTAPVDTTKKKEFSKKEITAIEYKAEAAGAKALKASEKEAVDYIKKKMKESGVKPSQIRVSELKKILTAFAKVDPTGSSFSKFEELVDGIMKEAANRDVTREVKRKLKSAIKRLSSGKRKTLAKELAEIDFNSVKDKAVYEAIVDGLYDSSRKETMNVFELEKAIEKLKRQERDYKIEKFQESPYSAIMTYDEYEAFISQNKTKTDEEKMESALKREEKRKNLFDSVVKRLNKVDTSKLSSRDKSFYNTLKNIVNKDGFYDKLGDENIKSLFNAVEELYYLNSTAGLSKIAQQVRGVEVGSNLRAWNESIGGWMSKSGRAFWSGVLNTNWDNFIHGVARKTQYGLEFTSMLMESWDNAYIRVQSLFNNIEQDLDAMRNKLKNNQIQKIGVIADLLQHNEDYTQEEIQADFEDKIENLKYNISVDEEIMSVNPKWSSTYKAAKRRKKALEAALDIVDKFNTKEELQSAVDKGGILTGFERKAYDYVLSKASDLLNGFSNVVYTHTGKDVKKVKNYTPVYRKKVKKLDDLKNTDYSNTMRASESGRSISRVKNIKGTYTNYDFIETAKSGLYEAISDIETLPEREQVKATVESKDFKSMFTTQDNVLDAINQYVVNIEKARSGGRPIDVIKQNKVYGFLNSVYSSILAGVLRGPEQYLKQITPLIGTISATNEKSVRTAIAYISSENPDIKSKIEEIFKNSQVYNRTTRGDVSLKRASASLAKYLLVSAYSPEGKGNKASRFYDKFSEESIGITDAFTAKASLLSNYIYLMKKEGKDPLGAIDKKIISKADAATNLMNNASDYTKTKQAYESGDKKYKILKQLLFLYKSFGQNQSAIFFSSIPKIARGDMDAAKLVGGQLSSLMAYAAIGVLLNEFVRKPLGELLFDLDEEDLIALIFQGDDDQKDKITKELRKRDEQEEKEGNFWTKALKMSLKDATTGFMPNMVDDMAVSLANKLASLSDETEEEREARREAEIESKGFSVDEPEFIKTYNNKDIGSVGLITGKPINRALHIIQSDELPMKYKYPAYVYLLGEILGDNTLQKQGKTFLYMIEKADKELSKSLKK